MKMNPGLSNRLSEKLTTSSSLSVDIDARLRLKTNGSSPPVQLGVWQKGGASWVGDSSWVVSPAFSETPTAVVSQAYHKEWDLLLTSFDRKDATGLGFVRELSIKNQSREEKRIKLLMHQQNPQFYEGVTFYAPAERALIHHLEESFALFSVHMPTTTHLQYGAGSLEKNWCAEEGRLFFAPFSAQTIESMVTASFTLAPEQEAKGHAWMLAGEQLTSVQEAHSYLSEAYRRSSGL
ncbi:hypothetical protein [Shouchella shacheensis]|uniref:hypothetical protein n=1 Tax=Shouchella shacheensis TaxID=1649580 RepID=UPI00073FD4D3|nr:hypothetical protein [Shouchella shacheensis]